MADEKGAGGTFQPTATETPVAAPVAPAGPSAAEQAEQEIVKKIKVANTQELAALTKQLLIPRPIPAPEPTPAPTAETPAGEETPAEETPAEEAPAETPEGGSEPEDEDRSEGPVTPFEGKRKHLRFSDADKTGRLAANFMSRNRDLTMEEALAKARTQLGIKAPGEATPAAAKSDLPETVEAVDQSLESLDAEREKALTDLRFEDVAKIDRNIRKLDRHRNTLERNAEREQSVQAAQYDAAFTKSETRAVELYPHAGDPNSEFGKRMLEVEQVWKETGNPLYDSPDKPLQIAHAVANEFKIAPRRPGAPVAPKANGVAPATNGAPKKQVLPGGGSRTATQSANVKPEMETRIAGIKTFRELKEFNKSLGITI